MTVITITLIIGVQISKTDILPLLANCELGIPLLTPDASSTCMVTPQ
jgi:hypothetical protein